MRWQRQPLQQQQDPVTIGVIGLGISAVNLGLNAAATSSAVASAERQQQLRRQIADLEAKGVEDQIERVNTVIARSEEGQGRILASRQWALEDTLTATDDYRREGLRTHGQQVLAYARSGVALSGSPMARLQETRDRIDEGVRRIQQRGQRVAEEFDYRHRQAQYQIDDLREVPERLRAQAEIIRLRGETGLDPSAVAISHLPGLVQAGAGVIDSAYGLHQSISMRDAGTQQQRSSNFYGSTPPPVPSAPSHVDSLFGGQDDVYF